MALVSATVARPKQSSLSEAFNSCLLRLRSPSTSVIVVEIAATEEVTAAPSAIEPIEVAAAKSCAPSAMEPMEVTVGSLLAQQQGFSSLQIQSEPLNRHAQLASAAVSTLNKCWSGTSKTAPCFELSDGPFFRPPQRSVIVVAEWQNKGLQPLAVSLIGVESTPAMDTPHRLRFR